MGNRNAKSTLRNAIVRLTISADKIEHNDENFWSQIWQEDVDTGCDVINSISTQEIRMLRDGSPKNFATLTYKLVEKLYLATGTLCNTTSQQTGVLNATRILTRLIPCIFEDKEWRNFFAKNYLDSKHTDSWQLTYPEKSDKDRNYECYLPPNTKNPDKTQNRNNIGDHDNQPENYIQIDLLADSMSSPTPSVDLTSTFKFTVLPHNDNHLMSSIDAPPEDLKSLPTCDYVWEPGVGFDSKVNSTNYYDKNRAELIKLLLAAMSSTLYEAPVDSMRSRNEWLEIFVSNSNRHALPLFASLLNIVLTFKPATVLPFNKLVFFDNNREELVELSIQLLMATLDHKYDEIIDLPSDQTTNQNLFIEYLSRIHREQDFKFMIMSIGRLLCLRIDSSYSISSTKQITFDQELLVLVWKFCNFNKRFIKTLLKSESFIDIVAPILYHLSENFQDPSKTALIHIGVFNLLILSGERDFGVRLNLAYEVEKIPNLPKFVGSFADLMIIVFHKLILYGFNINQLYDFLLTILVNISPYLKRLSLLACKCLIQLFETFSSPFVIFTEPNYHQLVIFMLEAFNNLIQYQYDGNTTLVYVILTKKDLFISLASLPSTPDGIDKVFKKLTKKLKKQEMMKTQVSNDKRSSTQILGIQHNSSHRQLGATISSNTTLQLEVSLVATPDICNVTQEIHPFDRQESQLEKVKTQSVEEPTINFDECPQIIEKPIKTLETYTDTVTTEVAVELPIQEEIESEEFGLLAGVDTIEIKSPPKWRPTPDWVKRYKQSLPIQSILRMIEVLTPQVETFKSNADGQLMETTTTKYLQSITLVGLLPVPHPISIRKYRTNQQTALWFRTCTWGMIYVRNSLWTDTDVKLIRVV